LRQIIVNVTVFNVVSESRSTKNRQRCWTALSLVCAGLLVWGGWAWWRGKCYRQAIAEIRTEMAAGRFATAASNLGKLLNWRPGSDEAAYLLGICEQERGRNQAADDAWSRVAPGSAHSEQAILARMRLLYEVGQVDASEKLIEDASLDPRNDVTALRMMLVPIYRQLGRIDDAQRIIEARWEHLNESGQGAMESAIRLVRMHFELTGEPAPVDEVRTFLDRAARLAPDDDRVWLGRAKLAIRTGAHDEAGRWLDACRKRRPNDVPTWRTRLTWGMAANRGDIVQEAMRHLPAAELTSAQVYRLNAWLFAQQGDVASERRGLELLIATDPADRTALNRLIRIAELDGRPADAAELNRAIVGLDRLGARYAKLHERNQPVRNAVEMAHLAEKLGRSFEARAFLTLAISENPRRDGLRFELEQLTHRHITIADSGKVLAEVVDQGREKAMEVGSRTTR
jgi:tetratricopeptide (TPR) repeat protein